VGGGIGLGELPKIWQFSYNIYTMTEKRRLRPISDKVLHNGLFVKLLKRNVLLRFVLVLQNWNGVEGDVFPIHCGVRQGGILSPMLFSIYMDDLLKELRESGYGAYFSNLFVGSILYS